MVSALLFLGKRSCGGGWRRDSLPHKLMQRDVASLSGTVPVAQAKLSPQERNRAMLYYLIVCRSLTYAQRTAAALERAGITAHTLRSPKSIAGEGCSHSVKISQRSLPDALRILQRVGLTPKRIYITAGDGSYQEVEL